MSKTFKDFDGEGRFKGVYLSKYLIDEEKTKVIGIPKYDSKNVRTFMDIKIGSAESRKVIFELFFLLVICSYFHQYLSIYYIVQQVK